MTRSMLLTNLLVTVLLLVGCPDEDHILDPADDDSQDDDDDTADDDTGDDDTTSPGDDDDTTPNPNDLDGDGWTPADGDCHEADPDIHPGADETLCDGVDSDCDGHGTDAAAVFQGIEYAAIVDAIAAAPDGETVFICPGTHTEQLIIEPDRELAITSWSGTYADTVLDGGAWNLILALQENASSAISHLTFMEGAADTWIGGGEGGGAISAASAIGLTVTGCLFIDNDSWTHGGAVGIDVADGQTMTADFDDCIFESNNADSSGGAISAGGWGDIYLEVRNSTFTSNTTGTEGGAINAGGWGDLHLTVEDSVFDLNTADQNGGAVNAGANNDMWVTISGSTFTGNHAGYEGAAVDLFIGDPHHDDVAMTAAITDTTFEDNTSGYAGGAVSVGGYATLDVTIDGCSFLNNEAYHSACALGLDGPESDLHATIANSTFEGNSCEVSGGTIDVGSSHSEMTITDCFLIGNAAQTAAGIYFGGGAAAEHLVSMIDTAVEDNIAASSTLNLSYGVSMDISGGSILRNQGGGAFLSTVSVSLTSSGVDWGAAADDNTPWDVWVQDDAEYTGYGAGATFTCTPGGGCL
jgi:predicted outer membrane repeat protein